jgi:hypothetical protein
MRKLRSLLALILLFSIIGPGMVVAQSLTLKKITVDRKGQLTDEAGKPVDWRYFPFTYKDREGKIRQEKGRARDRESVMFIDAALLNRKVLDDKTSKEYKEFLAYMAAERTPIQRVSLSQDELNTITANAAKKAKADVEAILNPKITTLENRVAELEKIKAPLPEEEAGIFARVWKGITNSSPILTAWEYPRLTTLVVVLLILLVILLLTGNLSRGATYVVRKYKDRRAKVDFTLNDADLSNSGKPKSPIEATLYPEVKTTEPIGEVPDIPDTASKILVPEETSSEVVEVEEREFTKVQVRPSIPAES